MDEVPCRHLIELRRHTMKDIPVPEKTTAELVEDEYLTLLYCSDSLVEALGADAFDIREYREEYDDHLSACADAIYHDDEMELGKLIMKRAKTALYRWAENNVRDQE